MTTITSTLVMEHAAFCAVFDQIEIVLAKLQSVREVQLFASLVEGLLKGHGETETQLAYAALDHVLEENGSLKHLHQDHQEIDEHFRRVHNASELADAQRLLKKALSATREHFRREEKTVFPFLERVLQPETLGALGQTWMQARSLAAPT